ncbi:MAG: PDZ domain-containing protein [Planctomycetota bacterium]
MSVFSRILVILLATTLLLGTQTRSVIADDPPKQAEPAEETKADKKAKEPKPKAKPADAAKKRKKQRKSKSDAAEAKKADAKQEPVVAESKPKPKDKQPNAKDKEPASESAKPAPQVEAAVKEEAKKEDKPAAERKPVAAKKESPAEPSLIANKDILGLVPWRSIGPANMSGRITDLSIDNADPSLWYVATASGGMLKSTNNGVVMEHQFDGEEVVSIGAVAHAASDANVVWVGTGEANPRNSVSYGNGVYKSVDGGKTWKHMGLEETYQIGRILIDPNDPNVVYVGALGRLYGPNRQRGVFKTTDGGETWKHVLYVNDNTGVIDMIMHPEEPGTIIAGLWDRMRDEFDSWPGSVKKPEGVDGYDPIRKWGKGGGLYKTSDSGENWTRLTKGLPPGKMGRIGLDWQTGGDQAIYAIIDCEDIGKGPKPATAFLGIVVGERDATGEGDAKEVFVAQVMTGSPAAKAGVKVGDVVTTMEGKTLKSGKMFLDLLREKKPGRRVALELARAEESVAIQPVLTPRPNSRAQTPTGYLGVTAEVRDEKVVLTTVTKASPAEQAGLKVGDEILKADDQAVETFDAVVKLLATKAIEDDVALSIKRGEETMAITATLGERPSRQPRQSSAFMGIQGEDQQGGGAKMLSVTDGGPSEKAGMKAGDVIIKVGDDKISDYAGLIAQIRSRKPGDVMKIVAKRKDKDVNLQVTLGDRNANTSNRPYTYSYFGQTPNIQDMQGAEGYRYGGIYRSDDDGETWMRVNSLNTRPMYFSVIRVDPSDAEKVYVLGVSQFASADGGITFQSNFGRGVHSDAHDLWIDPKDGRHMVIGGDGGVYATYDRGQTWNHINTKALGQFYHVAIIPGAPYGVVGGLQDNGSWAGPAISRSGGTINEDWFRVGGGDGFICRVDAEDPDLIYYESQNGSIGRRHLKTGERAGIRPARERGKEFRFNWEAPFLLSSHNSRLFYSAGNYVFRSFDRGNDLQIISPEITRTKRGSATEISESPRDPNVLYVGTDDGYLWVTTNGGTKWTRIDENLDAPGPRWVASIEASKFADGRVYVTLDGHRSDDDNPYVYVSEDFGKTFRPLHVELPRGSTRCLREDPENENLLYLGTEYAFWISLDRGEHWGKANGNLPTVAIHDVAVVPGGNEIVLATHGRSLWAGDVAALRAVSAKSMQKAAELYPIEDVVRWRRNPERGQTSPRYVGQNPARGAQIWYSLGKDAKKVQLQVSDVAGKTLRTLDGKAEAGLYRLTWDLTAQRTRPGGGRQAAGFRGGTFFVPSAPYRVTLLVDGKESGSQVVQVESDPALPVGAVADEVYEQELLREEIAKKLKDAAKDAGVDVYRDN